MAEGANNHERFPNMDGEPIEGVIRENIPYAGYGDITVSLDIYAPAGVGCRPVPVLLFLHGGSWIRGDKSTIRKGYKVRLLNTFLKEGYAIVSADYRLAGYGATLREQVVDCRNMVGWIYENAAQYGLDNRNIGIWGSSAGAHIAMYSTYSANKGDGKQGAKVSYIIDNFAPVNLPALLKPRLPRIAEKAVEIFARGSYMRRRVMLEALSGYDISDKAAICCFCDAYSLDNMQITNRVPTLILHGTGDKIVPYRQSVKIYEKLKRCGVETDLRLYEKLDHGFRGYTDADLDDIATSSLQFAKTYTRI